MSPARLGFPGGISHLSVTGARTPILKDRWKKHTAEARQEKGEVEGTERRGTGPSQDGLQHLQLALGACPWGGRGCRRLGTEVADADVKGAKPIVSLHGQR